MKILTLILRILKEGFLDEDLSTNLIDELKSYFFPPEGSYAKQIEKVLKAQSPFRLGKYTSNSFGETWTIIKPLSAKIEKLESIADSIQDSLAKHNCSRIVNFLKNPLRLVLFFNKPKTIKFTDLEDLMTKENRIYAFVMDSFLCSVSFEKEIFSHLLITGITGSGKTVLLKSILASLIKTTKPKIYFCNPKNDESFNYLKTVTSYATSKENITETITLVFKEMENRLLKSKPDKVFLVVDEISLLSKEEKEKLTKIANVGRSLGIHLILATQRPTKETLPTELRSQMTYTLTGRCQNKKESYYASGIADSNAEKLIGSGLFYLNASGYNNVLVQVLFIEETKPNNIIIPVEIIQEKKDIFENASKVVLNRKDWIEEILPKEFTTLKDLQDSHKDYYGKMLNVKTAKQIKDFIDAT